MGQLSNVQFHLRLRHCGHAKSARCGTSDDWLLQLHSMQGSLPDAQRYRPFHLIRELLPPTKIRDVIVRPTALAKPHYDQQIVMGTHPNDA